MNYKTKNIRIYKAHHNEIKKFSQTIFCLTFLFLVHHLPVKLSGSLWGISHALGSSENRTSSEDILISKHCDRNNWASYFTGILQYKAFINACSKAILLLCYISMVHFLLLYVWGVCFDFFLLLLFCFLLMMTPLYWKHFSFLWSFSSKNVPLYHLFFRNEQPKQSLN